MTGLEDPIACYEAESPEQFERSNGALILLGLVFFVAAAWALL